MSLKIPAIPQISFFLRTTKPFHNATVAREFLRLISSCGEQYRPFKYGNVEPLKEFFNEKNLDDVVATWLGGKSYSQDVLEREYCQSQLMMKGRAPSKVNYFISWRNWTDKILFNCICVNISKEFLKKNEIELDKFVEFCDNTVRMFHPVHAEIYDYTDSIICTSTENALIPDDLSVRCPALKWRTYFGPPYIELLGRKSILSAPCWKVEEVGDTIALQLTESVFKKIPQELRQKVVNYFEFNVDPQIRADLGSGFIFRPFSASEYYSKSKKLVPSFPIYELFGKNISKK